MTSHQLFAQYCCHLDHNCQTSHIIMWLAKLDKFLEIVGMFDFCGETDQKVKSVVVKRVGVPDQVFSSSI